MDCCAPPTSFECTCGLLDRREVQRKRVIGGAVVDPVSCILTWPASFVSCLPAQVNKYPWVVAVTMVWGDGSHSPPHCGGTLVSSRYVVTSANCAQLLPGVAALAVRLGEHSVCTAGETKLPEKVVRVNRTIAHESYDRFSNEHDIALLELEEYVDLGVYTPACLARATDTYEGRLTKIDESVETSVAFK